MQTNKPPRPPGRPTIAQRAAAIQLTARAHGSPRGEDVARGHALMIPSDPHYDWKYKTLVKNKVPNIVTIRVDELDEQPSFKTNQRPRFMRWKNKDEYHRVEKEDGKDAMMELDEWNNDKD